MVSCKLYWKHSCVISYLFPNNDDIIDKITKMYNSNCDLRFSFDDFDKFRENQFARCTRYKYCTEYMKKCPSYLMVRNFIFILFIYLLYRKVFKLH